MAVKGRELSVVYLVPPLPEHFLEVHIPYGVGWEEGRGGSRGGVRKEGHVGGGRGWGSGQGGLAGRFA